MGEVEERDASAFAVGGTQWKKSLQESERKNLGLIIYLNPKSEG